MTKYNFSWFVYIFVCLLLGWSYILWAYTGYSQGEPDSLWFLPPAVSYHNGEGLYNKIHEPSQIFDPAHEQRFLFYPPGFQLFLSAILPEGTGRGAFFALAMLNFLTLLLSSFLFYRVLVRKDEVLTGRKLFLGILGMLALSTYLGGFRLGRPDFLATLLILLMFFVQMRTHDRTKEILSAVLLGSLAFVHPVAALFTSALLGICYARDHTLGQVIFRMIRICFGGVVLFFLLMVFSPHGLEDSFRGILLHAQNTMELGTPQPFWKYWIMHSYASCYGILLITAVEIAAYGLWYERAEIISKAGVIIFTIILALFFYRFVGIAWDRSYNLWVFTPLMIAILLAIFKQEWARRRVTITLVSIVLLLCSVGYFHSAALFGFYLKDGYKYEEARQSFQKFMSEHPDEIIGVSKSLWVLSEEYDRMRSFGLTPEHLRSKPGWIVLQQRFALKYTPMPPKFKGYELVSHNFSLLRPMLFGVQLSPTMPGYFYAVYRAKN